MTAFPLTGITEAAMRLFGIVLREDDRGLEQQINREWAEQREKITASSEDITSVGDMIKDYNPIHRSKELAIKKNLLDTPLMGAHTAIYGAQFIQGVTDRMKKFWGADIQVVSQKSRFPSPIYPGDKIKWQIVNFKEIPGKNIDLAITGYRKRDNESKEAVNLTASLGNRYFIPEIRGVPIYSQSYLITEELIRNLHQRTGGNSSEKPLAIFATSYVPTTLTNLLLEKANSLEGTNASMNFKFTGELQPGELTVDIYKFEKTRPRGGAYWYNMDAHCRQGGKSVAYGTMLAIADQDVELPFSLNPLP
ncbi:hypothetical protein KW805_01465 [Candidatus Pacearchaeota archaeon]|nr:hypothetical protein [Candidatus Pacearchaeota archaeon]